MGVPRPDGYFGKCNPKNKKNYRSRCSALIKTKNENVLIDTSPDLRQQLIKNNIKKIDKVFYSHMHADQTHGINDLRSFFLNSRKPINIYADKFTSNYLLKNLYYLHVVHIQFLFLEKLFLLICVGDKVVMKWAFIFTLFTQNFRERSPTHRVFM